MGSMWKDLNTINSQSYICGYCGERINSNQGYYLTNFEHLYNTPSNEGFIYICHNCNMPTYIDWEKQIPGPMYGKNFEKEIFSDEKTFTIYNEIRKCFSAGAYSSCVLSARKLLMHIAVDCGARENQSFTSYIDYLDENNYIPKNCKEWVNIIREKGNEVTHQIEIFGETDARQIINFIEILINVIYAMKYQADEYINNE